MRDEYLVACHLVDQSEEIYGHLSRGVRRGSGPSRRNLNFNESYSKLNECAPWGKGHTSPQDLDLDNVYAKRTTVSVLGHHQAAGISEPEGLHQHQVRQ